MIPPNLVKARLEEISWNKDQQIVEGQHKIPVQFNPDSLKVSLSNQTSGGDQTGGSAIQFVGSGTTKLTFDLWFDVTNPEHNKRQVKGFIPDDVRLLTEEVAFFMKPKPSEEKNKFIPPGVRFLWGRFLFEGIMESLNEEVSYFSEDGRPLRAKLSVSLTRQEIQFAAGKQKANGVQSGASSGSPRQQAKQDDTVPDLAGAAGNPERWPAVAAANGIENPRQLAAGTVLNVSAAAGGSASFGASAGISAGVGFSAGASAGASASFGASASAGAGFGASAGGGLGGGLRAGASASAGGGIGGGLGGGIGGGVGGGIGGGVSASVGIGGGMGAGASLGIGGGAVGVTAAAGGGSVGASASLGGAAASASARANAAFDLRVRR